MSVITRVAVVTAVAASILASVLVILTNVSTSVSEKMAPDCYGLTSDGCDYLHDLWSAGAPVQTDAMQLARIICVNLKSETVGAQVQAFHLSHLGGEGGESIDQSVHYIGITKRDVCDTGLTGPYDLQNPPGEIGIRG
jgi:hypothetical protein